MKRSHMIGIAVALMLPLFCILFGIVHIVLYHIHQYDAAMNRYREDFCIVRDHVWQQFPDRRTETYQSSDAYPWLYISQDENGHRKLYDPNTNKALQTPEVVTQALNRIATADAFPAHLDGIWFEEGQIQFRGNTAQGWYALIYSPEGRPTSFGSHAPEEVCIKWIGGGWYHATRLEDWMVIAKWFS